MFGEEAVCPDILFVPAVFRESDFYLNSLIFVFMGTLLGTIVIVLVAWTEFCYKFGVR